MRALSRLRFRTTSTRLRSLRRTAVQEGKNEDATAQNQRLSGTRFPPCSDDHTLRRPHLIIQEALPDRCREIPMQHLRRFRKPGSGTMLRGPLDPPCPPNSLCSSCSSTQRQRSLRDGPMRLLDGRAPPPLTSTSQPSAWSDRLAVRALLVPPIVQTAFWETSPRPLFARGQTSPKATQARDGRNRVSFRVVSHRPEVGSPVSWEAHAY